MTPGRRWRFRRNLAIYIAWRGGLPQRLLADVHDLPQSRVCEICQAMRVLDRDEIRSARNSPGPGRYRVWSESALRKSIGDRARG